jgi:hypothetical protein
MSRLHLPRRAASASGVCMWCVAAALASVSVVVGAAASAPAHTARCVSWKRVPSPALGDWWQNLSAVSARSPSDAWAVPACGNVPRPALAFLYAKPEAPFA